MSIWYPFTQMADLRDFPMLKIVEGKDNYLFDENGKKYFDGISSLWTTVHGHNHPHINQRIIQQIQKLSHSTLLGLSHDKAEEFAATLLSIAPSNLKRVFFSDSGSTAVEIALKQSFQYRKMAGHREKTSFIKIENSYHGDTLGAVGVGGIPIFHHVFGPLLKDSFTIPCPVSKHGIEDVSARSVEVLKDLLKEHHKKIAALIMEPAVQGAGGILVAPSGYLKCVSELCRKFDIHLILDEVATGFGRTGRMFACEEDGVQPDFLCLGKGITGGYLPLAATLTTSNIFEMFLSENGENRTFFHGHTYTGNPLACAAGLASLEVFEKEKTLANVEIRAKELHRNLEGLINHPHVISIRQKGLMCGVEFVKSKNPIKSFDDHIRVGRKIALKARDYGVILRNLGDIVVLMPPLSSSSDEIELLCRSLSNSIDEVL